MSARPIKPFGRFVDTDGDAAAARIRDALLNVVRPEPLDTIELARVRARLHTPRARPLGPARYAALLATGMLAGTGFAVASYGVQRFWNAPPSIPSAVAPAASVEHRPFPPKARRQMLPEPKPAPEMAPPLAVAPPQAHDRVLGRESESLARALAKLRRDRDPDGALALLNEHARSFPNGALGQESDLVRLDALLSLGRNDEALVLLERLPIDRLGRGAELRVIRGELVARNDPTRALVDFDRALGMGLRPELEERALFGRAASRLRAGDEGGGRADLATYLAKYPNGRFAGEARRF